MKGITNFCLSLPLLLLVTNSCSRKHLGNRNELLQFGEVTVSLKSGCELVLKGVSFGIDTVINVDLPYPNTCDFVRLQPGTNIVHAERYYDAWIVLIQSYKKIDREEKDPRFGCDTRYKAFIILDDGRFFLNPKSNGGSGCPPIHRDRHEFTSLAHEYVNHDDK